jgi:ribosomal protein S18 acetylase RimI-like enzyme
MVILKGVAAMDIEFHTMRTQEFSELESMMHGLYTEDSEGEPMHRDKIQATIRELTQYPEKGRIVVFTVASDIVGYALVIFYWSNEYGGHILHIDELFVKSAWRGQGIATRFFSALPLAGMPSPKALQLEVTPSNPRAQAYYEQLGFQVSVNAHLVKKIV